ncbi:hypothetical protein [Streptomyces sp. AcH 505]|uniref:hypothetical protein n=1 Tax=Streptomyces sp. AcH 505 TaxID=352211 RepID=UPI0018E3A368
MPLEATCASVLAAADFSDLVAFLLFRTFAAAVAAFLPVVPLLLGAWETALADAVFLALVAFLSFSDLPAAVAAFSPVWLVFFAMTKTPFRVRSSTIHVLLP